MVCDRVSAFLPKIVIGSYINALAVTDTKVLVHYWDAKLCSTGVLKRDKFYQEGRVRHLIRVVWTVVTFCDTWIMSHHGVSVWKYIMGWWISKAIDFEIAWVCDSIRTEVAALNLRTIIVDFRKLKIWSWKVWDWGNCSSSRFTDERTCLTRSCDSIAIWSHYLRFASCHSNSGDLSALLIIIIKFHFHYLFRKDHGKFLLVTLFLFYEVLVAFEPALIIYTCYRHESLVYALAGRI